MSRAFYNEIDPYAAQWLRNLIDAGHIAPGDVDTRSIVDVHPDDLVGYTQCHFFAGIGGWSLAARLAGWPDDRPLWTGSEPCQPYSVAGKGLAEADDRYLRPHVHRLVAARRPVVYVGEQVAAAAGKNWLDRVHSDMESIGYTCRSVVVPACAVDAPHRRDRLWFVADAGSKRRQQVARGAHGDEAAHEGRPAQQHHVATGDGESQRSPVADACGTRLAQRERITGVPGEALVASARQDAAHDGQRGGTVSDTDLSGASEEWQQRGGEQRWSRSNSAHRPWSEAEWAIGADGKARRVEPGIRLLAHGVPARVGKLRAYGNAIVPQVAAEVIAAYLETEHLRLTGEAA